MSKPTNEPTNEPTNDPTSGPASGSASELASRSSTALERRARMLLRAYPPPYRRDRGEEMLGTLLEATPVGQSWPRARDAWSMLAGGRRARAARNRQAGPAASLRQAAILAITLFLSLLVNLYLDASFTASGGSHAWAGFTVSVLLAALVLAMWSGRRSYIALTGLAASAALAYEQYGFAGKGETPPVLTAPLALLALLAVLAPVLLTRRAERPPRSWLLLPGGITALNLIGQLSEDQLAIMYLLMLLLTIIWLITDARPVAAMAFFVVLVQLNRTWATQRFLSHGGLVMKANEFNLVILAVTVAVTTGLGLLVGKRARTRPGAAS